MSFAPMVRTTDSGPFVGNALRFATANEAQKWMDALMCRWYALRDVRVDESTDPVNYSTVDGVTLVEVK
jgi:hypothetical protein